MSEEPSKHLTLFSSETVNIKELANLTANTKDYGQITRNTKPHSDPLIGLIISCGPAMLFRSRGSFRINHRNILTEEAWVNVVPGLNKLLHRTKIVSILLHFMTLCQEAKFFPSCAPTGCRQSEPFPISYLMNKNYAAKMTQLKNKDRF